MMRWFSNVRLLVDKECRLEFRGKELLTLLVCNAILMAALVGAGASSAMVNADAVRRMFAPLMLLVFLFSVTASVNRGNEQELEGRGFEGLILSGFTPVQMYISKVFVTWVYLCLAFCLVAGCMGVLLNQSLWALWRELLLIGAVTSLGISALMVILVVMASTSRVKGVLLPIISLPLLFPVFFAATELAAELLARGALDFGSVWVSVLACADVVYLALGLNLFEFVVKE